MKSLFIFMTTLVRISKFLTNFEDFIHLNLPNVVFWKFLTQSYRCTIAETHKKHFRNVSCYTYRQTRHVESESGVVFNRCKSTSCQARENGSPKRDDETRGRCVGITDQSDDRRKSQNCRDTRSRALRPPNIYVSLTARWMDDLTRWRVDEYGNAGELALSGTSVPCRVVSSTLTVGVCALVTFRPSSTCALPSLRSI